MKVFGSGFISKNLKKINLPKKFDIYAAGVSNSNLKGKKEYIREIRSIKIYLSKRNKKKVLIYISSISVLNTSFKKDNYTINKKKIEKIIREQVSKYLIIRLPQIVGKNYNKKTLTNFIRDKILQNKTFYLWKNSKRNLIDIDDIKIILNKYLRNNLKINNTINIFNPSSIEVKKLIILFGKVLKKNPKIKVIKKNNKNINFSRVPKSSILPKLFYKSIKKKHYIKNLLLKYYK